MELISITENIDTTSPSGRMFILMTGVISQWEEDSITWRTERGLIESAKQGNYCKPGAPIGYKRNPKNNKRLIIDPESSAVAKYIFDSITSGEKTAFELGKELKKDKVLGYKWEEHLIYKE